MSRRARQRTSTTALLALTLCWACRSRPTLPTATATVRNITVSGAFAFAPVTPDVGSAYFSIQNTDSTADTLVAVTTTVASMVMLHGQVRDGGIVRMEQLPRLVIPPHGKVRLALGETHVMIMDFSRVPEAGDSIPLTLDFAHAGTVQLTVPVRPYGEDGD